jgi:single-strand DNA-binding protein
MSNTIVIIGNLGRDPEQRTPGAGPVTLNVADSTGYGDRKRTTWRRVSVWGKTGEYCLATLRKGDMVQIVGEESQDEWTGADGAKRVTSEVNASRVDGPFQRRSRDDAPERRPAPARHADPQPYSDDEDIPF